MVEDIVVICEKPDSVSWEQISEVLVESHAENRQNGVYMPYPHLPPDEIRKKIEGRGIMLVAMMDEKLVGTAAMVFLNKKLWCGSGKYAYCCFASILPEYNGKGIYKEMCRIQEEMAREAGLNMMMFDTHEKNSRNLGHSIKAGYKFVDLKFYRDHYNVVMVKGLDGCPYSSLRCSLSFFKRKWYVKTRTLLGRLKQLGGIKTHLDV